MNELASNLIYIALILAGLWYAPGTTCWVLLGILVFGFVIHLGADDFPDYGP